jgi:hypothetical protein
MQIKLRAEDVQLTKTPDGVRASVPLISPAGPNDSRIVIYLNKEEGEKDWTGYTKGRGGIGYRLHIVRNGTGKKDILLEVQDEPQDSEYHLYYVDNTGRGLPIKSIHNETTRRTYLRFYTAEEAAAWEDWYISEHAEQHAINATREIRKVEHGVDKNGLHHSFAETFQVGNPDDEPYTVYSLKSSEPIPVHFGMTYQEEDGLRREDDEEYAVEFQRVMRDEADKVLNQF